MNRTHLHRPTSRGSLFQWSVADRTVAACGTGLIGEQPPSGLVLTARIADNRGRFAAHRARRPMNRKIFSGRPLRRGTWPEVTAAEKKPRLGAYPHPDQTGFDGDSSRSSQGVQADAAWYRSGAATTTAELRWRSARDPGYSRQAKPARGRPVADDATELVVETQHLTKIYQNRQIALNDVTLDHRAGLRPRPARPQRRRQDHVPAPDPRPAPADRRLGEGVRQGR